MMNDVIKFIQNIQVEWHNARDDAILEVIEGAMPEIGGGEHNVKINLNKPLIEQALREKQKQINNFPLGIAGIKQRIGKPIFVTVDDRSWWDVVKDVKYHGPENKENSYYVHLAIFGPVHYKTFKFYEFEKE